MAIELHTADDAPWKRRYRVSPVRAMLARANQDHGLLFSNRSGKYELYAWEMGSGVQRQLTDRPAGTLMGFISPDGAWVYYLDDREGDETGHFVRVPFTGGPPQDMTPGLPLYSTWSAGVNDMGTLFGLTIPGPDGFDFYVLEQLPDGGVGEPRLLHRSPTISDGPVFSADGSVAVWQTARRGTLTFGLLAFEVASGEQIAELRDDDASVECEPGSCSPVMGDTRILATTDRSGEKRPLIWNPRTGERRDLDGSDLEGEVEPWAWAPDARSILLCRTFQAQQDLYRFELETGSLVPLQAPDGTYSSPCFLPNSDIAIGWQDSTHPARLIALDGGTGRKKAGLLTPEEVPPGRPWRSILVRSSDGQEVQAWVAVPEGEGPFPTILETHGGPTSAQLNTFRPNSQAWLDHGFAYCSVNYRGSTTFGRAFKEQIWGDLGHWEVEDMAAVRQRLVEEGIAQPDAVFLTGWSYGGYLTLQALGTHPDLWAGGMGGVVVADWVSQYEDESETLRGYDVGLFGGTLEEKREQYVKSSPITYLDQVTAPALIIQGRNDTRDPPRQVELYEAKARELDKPVEVVWFDTGHAGSVADRELGIAHQELMMQFAYRVLASPPVARPDPRTQRVPRGLGLR